MMVGINKEQFSNAEVAEEKVLDTDEWLGTTEDKFKAGSFMKPKTGSDMSEKREEAEPPITVQTENVHDAVAGQENADQDGHDDHAVTATRDQGDGAENIPYEEIQTRPRKPSDTECLKLKKINPGLLMTGILLIRLMLMMNPMIMISGPVRMDTYGGGNKLNDIEYKFVYTEKNTMGPWVMWGWYTWNKSCALWEGLTIS